MKKICVFTILLFFIFTKPSHAIVVECINCSDLITQVLGYVVDVEDLGESVKQYEELFTQTLQGIEMIQQNINQYMNMVQNTLTLPSTIKNKLIGNLKTLVGTIKGFGSYYDDMMAMKEIFNDIYPDFDSMQAEVLGASPIRTRISNYRTHCEKWREEVDKSLEITFGVTGEQLQSMIDSGEFESQVSELLSTPEGQMQALDAGNQLAGMQLEESRNLRALLASYIQTISQIEKKREMERDIEIESKLELYDMSQGDPSVSLPTGW